MTASTWLFCHFFKLPSFTSFLWLPFLWLPFLYFLLIPSFTLLSFLFTFQILLYFPSLTLLSIFYFIFFSFSKLLPLSDTLWSDPTRSDFAIFNPSFSCFLVRFICICCCFPFTGLKYLIFYSITISHHGEMFQTNTWQD